MTSMAATAARRPSRERRRSLLMVVLIGIAALAGWGLWTTLIASSNNAPEYRLAKVERGNLTSTVSAAGTLNAVTTVQVGSTISGQIKDLIVRGGENVSPREVTIDDLV